jgi:hypothetical protein
MQKKGKKIRKLGRAHLGGPPTPPLCASFHSLQFAPSTYSFRKEKKKKAA